MPLRSFLATGLVTLAVAAVTVPAGAGSFESVIKGNSARELSRWGRRFEHGEGVVRDIDHAIRLYCKAAARGDAAAHYHLGWIYAVGRTGERDDALAAAWLHRAAQQNDAHAERMLARLGYTGEPRQDAVCLLSDGGRANGEGAVVRPMQAGAGGGGTREVAITREHPAQGRVATLVRRLAPDYRLSPTLVLAVIEVESDFNPRARSPKNAQGLMQLIPETAERFGVRDVWDPEQNIRGGMAYLRWLTRYFDGDLELVLAAYNAGEGAVERYGGIPPYAETQDYVRRIIERLN
ncbi:MAG: transglycosylase SLT domain-containing protein [Gammaproteobacteria bacterium]|jgi:soluble lytic murein transglycosylase-like protein|nr:transglycosylase SLT domain-containing protein [Gammaproteobacteria bacterium]